MENASMIPYRPEYLDYRPIFTDAEKNELAALAADLPLSELKTMPRAFENSAIEYAFVSSQIERNSYTLKDTVALLKFGMTVGSKPFNDALMIKNINEAYEAICLRENAIYPTLSKPFVCGLHETLSHGLLHKSECGILREKPVTIAGTSYVPLSGAAMLDAELSNLLEVARSIENPFECAVYVHMNLAYLQCFSDCNKRTARLMQTAVMADKDIIPVLLQTTDIVEYQFSVVDYYETGNYRGYADLFVQAFRHSVDQVLGRTPEQQEAQALAEEAIRRRSRNKC